MALPSTRTNDATLRSATRPPTGRAGPAPVSKWGLSSPLGNRWGHFAADPALHATLLAYVSDFFFVGTALLPHGVSWLTPGMQVASLDHAMWFHDDLRADAWLLHSIESPRAARGRGLVRGRVFSRDGRLVASSAQEGLIRMGAPRETREREKGEKK